MHNLIRTGHTVLTSITFDSECGGVGRETRPCTPSTVSSSASLSIMGNVLTHTEKGSVGILVGEWLNRNHIGVLSE